MRVKENEGFRITDSKENSLLLEIVVEKILAKSYYRKAEIEVRYPDGRAESYTLKPFEEDIHLGPVRVNLFPPQRQPKSRSRINLFLGGDQRYRWKIFSYD